ncbi:hypothetical protein OAR97_07065 [Arcobacteraceae bacterium]|nr:hypothetical protein [Arcobacteraceae bacterium]
MVTIIALEKIIKDFELRVAVSKGQLSRHNSGEEKLSLLAESSAENSLEEHAPLLDKYRKMLKEFVKIEKLDSYSHRRLRAAIERKKYYKYNIKKNTNNTKKQKFRENDERIEAAMIIDELPEEIVLDNEELFEISTKNLERYLNFSGDVKNELFTIQEEFNNLIKSFTDENIKSLELLNYTIPILIFHFHILKLNIIEQNEEQNIKVQSLGFFPKYNDWWIQELWESHIAYFSLMKWKSDVSDNCITDDLKKGWAIIYNNWIFIKTLINEKSDLAFEYQYILDTLLFKYANLESELDKKIVEKAKNEMKEELNSKKYSVTPLKCEIVTPYVNYKISNKKNL